MDLNDWRSLLTVVGLVAFLFLVRHAYKPANKAGFEHIARMALEDDMPVQKIDGDSK